MAPTERPSSQIAETGCRHLCGSHPARREAGRSPGAVSDQVRDGREPQDRQGAWTYGAAIDFAARRRGHRVKNLATQSNWTADGRNGSQAEMHAMRPAGPDM